MTTPEPFPTNLTDTPYITPWKDIIEAQPATMLIDGLLPKAQTTWLYGATGIGKSLIVMQMVLDVANQRAVFGRLAAQPCNVLWLDYENGLSETRTRIEAFGQDILSIAGSGRLHFGIMPPAATDQPQQLIELIQWLDIGLLIIDSSGVGITGDSNSADTYADLGTQLLNPLKRIEVTTIILDNIGKDSKKGAIGSARKLHEAGSAWELKQSQQNLYHLHSRKSRIIGLHTSITIEKHADPLRFAITGGQGATSAVLTGDQQNIVVYLDTFAGAKWATNRELHQAIKTAGLGIRASEMDAAIRWWNRGNHTGIN